VACAASRRAAHLVLVGHGSASFPGASRPLLRHAERLRKRAIFTGVDYGSLFGEPSIEEVARRIPKCATYVVPLLMSDGHYARSVIGRLFAGEGRIGQGDAPLTICRPIGVHPRLAEVIAGRALERLSAQRLPPEMATLLLIAHGSRRNGASREATEIQADSLCRMKRFRGVHCAFLDQAPEIHEALGSLTGPVVAAGLFAGEGLHATQDLPVALDAYRSGPLLDLGSVGADPAIAQIVLDEVAEAEAEQPCAAFG
jgi:sirohydrochlorin ferrochelatase